MKVEVKSIAYHRNGISDIGFHAVIFTMREAGKPREMLGIVFPERGAVAVLDTEFVSKGNITFGDNSWRGDWFEPDLRKAITAWEAKRSKEEAPQ